MKFGEQERLDRLLEGLSAVEPDEAFEARMVAGVRARSTPREVRPSGAARWTWGIPVSLAAGCALIVGIGLHPARQSSAGTHQARANNSPEKAGRLQPFVGRPQDRTPDDAHSPGGVHAERVHVMPGASTPAPPHGLRPPDQGAEAAKLESFPPPPAPLTEQEKLLLKIAHNGDPVELATLNPGIAEGLRDKSRSEVQQFFYKPPVVDDKGNLIASANNGDNQ